MLGTAITLMLLMPLRILDLELRMYLLALVILPVGVPILYSMSIPIRLRSGDVTGSRIVKFTLEYDDDVEESIIADIARRLGRLSLSEFNAEARRVLLSMVNLHGVGPRAIREEHIDMSRILGGKGARIYLVDSHLCNASSMGIMGLRVIIITTRLLSLLDPEELSAVIAHEIGHLVHGDSMKVLSMVSLNQLINVILILYLVPVAPLIPLVTYPLENLLLLYIVRLSEYSADKYALRSAGREALIGALLKVAWRDAYMEFLGRGRVLGTHPPVLRRLTRIMVKTQ
jgi:heat shock protein HtpX